MLRCTAKTALRQIFELERVDKAKVNINFKTDAAYANDRDDGKREDDDVAACLCSDDISIHSLCSEVIILNKNANFSLKRS